ncbi:hypothetical protein EMIHUDRAFT_216233 [Emiliania huxleyi CCMP1516]|uniref:MYND-type domain-containing protein n=2 Tax=Emiliania huxleyi TaxID=2903 RepID=A0A0D3IFM7_EMIH1|nr:hypothetical protein EMIHUDRAFT_216233 [Emiliania huxleyi CCMP1516]EOD10062.1 hypothetical protein EMIHUDRAFT_216233 [Emiliania huxleyi CCMP1516]|eukprot:XP_005762491.1 hypothetical protein EMIHUDRAFT_216233 [Emiliania huxleyi CCMP1516]
MSTVDGERYEVRTKRPDSTGKIRTLVVHPSSIVALSLCAVCATLAPKATSLDCDVCGKLYCSEECQRRDRDNGHDRECRHRSVLLEAFRDRSRRLGDLPRTSSLVAGELLDRASPGKEPLCRCDTVEQSEVRPLFVRMRLAAGESGIINTERIMERNRVFGDSTALCFEMAQGCSLEMREYSGGLVFQTTKSIKSFDEIWAQYRTDLHWFGMRGHIRSMEPSERAQQIAELVREGIGGYAYRRMLWPTGRSAPPLAERQQWVRRLETLGWLDTPENTRETVRQTGKRLPDEYDQVEADLAAVRRRRRRSGGASDEARVIAKAGALRHDGEQAMNRGRAAVALDRYQQAIELLQFASEPAALTSLAEPWSDSLTATPGQRLTVPDSLTALTALSLTEASSAEFFEEIRKLLADFNVSIQEESKDRKLRFHVKRLIKSHQQRGEDVDEELDFYMDDDDVAVLFTMEDSSKVFAIGNIEQVAVADGTVDARRATGSSSAEYLRQLSMSQRSNGVFINDPKGLFILRWYREVKGDGTPPDGPRYQNRACKYYKLTSDNDGEAFRWTSNYQIISKVYLKKHSTLPLCYSLSAADKKMVTSTMKKMVGPEAE